jgi:hypothetical protein
VRQHFVDDYIFDFDYLFSSVGISTLASVVEPSFMSLATTIYMVVMGWGVIFISNVASAVVAVYDLTGIWPFSISLCVVTVLVALTLIAVDGSAPASLGEMNRTPRRLKLNLPRWPRRT